ncbi:uncharacterized protein LOC100124222 [Nasonia vitripennis]|uniref:HTH CENPB-type domain-containing protein n=1 Tax=Nasonia vitripennis TaxID=7425 RepID=A0A7M7TB31_NASVI|nr:uncharacterized protein LOC100124222 [Nasonia vitripennis]
MVRKYKRKGQRQLWSKDSMRTAIEAVISNNMSVRRASIEHKIPQATLSRKIHQIRSGPPKDIELIVKPWGSNFQTVFNKEQESVLCEFIHTLENQFIPFNSMDVRKLAYQLAEKFNVPHPFNKDFAVAGDDWYKGFLKRNPEICIKKLDINEKTKDMKKAQVYKFFDLLEGLTDKHQLEACDIYNLDETVITCSLNTNEDEAKNTEESSGQNKLVTATVCFSASGAYAPLMLIFPCSTYKNSILKGAPPGAWAEYDQSGQMQLDIFVTWLKKFIKFSKASKHSPVLLIVDAYHTFLKKLHVLELAKENGVNILCLPPYCTEKFQPMQQEFMNSLSTAYTSEVAKWTRSNPGRSVSTEEVYQLFGNAFMKISTMALPVHGFHRTGIWPIDRDQLENVFVEFSEKESTLNLPRAAVKEASSSINDSFVEMAVIPEKVVSKEIVQKPVVVITQSHNQSYVVQSLETINQQNMEFIQQTFIQESLDQAQVIEHYSVVDEQHTESIIIENATPVIQETEESQIDDELSSVIIPPEAQLCEVQFEDLQNLIQSRKRLHYYVSPYRFNLSR